MATEPLVPVMTPAPGQKVRRFVGDQVQFTMQDRDRRVVEGWQARLRTNLGRGELLRREIVQAHTCGVAPAGASWRDLPMRAQPGGWTLEIPLAEAGFFRAKAFLEDPRGWQHWPTGPDVSVAVHPNCYRTANSIYCAFARLFGPSQRANQSETKLDPAPMRELDQEGYTVIPPSGKLRDLTTELPHIVGRLGCRILHLLPVNPTPTTYARFGRFGSPYAALDLTAIDPALVVFDRRTTGVDQFRELAYATHVHGARLFLDIVINHTGWGSVLQENHPEWFLRQGDGSFQSPGAWGVIWEDLVELKHQNLSLWDDLAEVFLTWCRRGVDGFRCDAGYKVPVAAWQYIVARVQEEYPQALFLLEGLGGAWETTEALLGEGGMQWAYSELFQNYSGPEVAGYLDHSFSQSERVGLLVHYSETHDNARLAAKSRAWSLLRNRLCALASVSGGFGFTCGVEWLATEKVDVHGCCGLAWGNEENVVQELAKLNELLAGHPCFFDGAVCTRLSPVESPVYALLRQSPSGEDAVLVLVNTDVERPRSLSLDLAPLTRSGLPTLTKASLNPGRSAADSIASSRTGVGPTATSGREAAVPFAVDLLGQTAPKAEVADGRWTIGLAPGAAYCLATCAASRGLSGERYRAARARAAWGLGALARIVPLERLSNFDWQALAGAVDRGPAQFLTRISRLASETGLVDLKGALHDLSEPDDFPRVVVWSLADGRRITPIPPGYWLLVQDMSPFRASLERGRGSPNQNVESIPAGGLQVACFGPDLPAGDGVLRLERFAERDAPSPAAIRFLAARPELAPEPVRVGREQLSASDLVLLTNGRGGMARLCVDLGRVTSKYDCVLGANLHPSFPVDRHILAKRIRLWLNADGFISPLDFLNLATFQPGPPAVWTFLANAGDGRTVGIEVTADMLEERNVTVFHFHRPQGPAPSGQALPAQADVRLTARVELEDRNFHCETKRNPGADFHFSSNVRPWTGSATGASDAAGGTARELHRASGQLVGFAFTPAPDRQLRVFSDAGWYHAQPEWSLNIAHPVEGSRGQVDSGDAFSPGWFELPLAAGGTVRLVVSAEPENPSDDELISSQRRVRTPQAKAAFAADDAFGQQLLRAANAFVVRRGKGKTVIAGYPWFLDWGRDTFICARGLLAAGKTDDVLEMLINFARFEQNGTLPNTVFGEDTSNRDTSDAPLWFGLACEELAALAGTSIYQTRIGRGDAVLAETLWNIGVNYAKGTPNGIRMDAESALIWSPSHFTWMDTNHPAGTPREGYPVEIQALWIRLLRQLEGIHVRAEREGWAQLAARALDSLENLFWHEPGGYYADVLLGGRATPAGRAVADTALRSNCLLSVSLGLVKGARARSCVEAARRHLVVPGGLRSLAPLPVSVPLPIYGRNGQLLNDPSQPYWGRYEGDEDTRRKPAYHNGTAWTWTFPIFCEALARAWDFQPSAMAAARAYLGSMASLMAHGCLGQIPEILDGDAPHTARGCDAQAWGVTEALRVWKQLQLSVPSDPDSA